MEKFREPMRPYPGLERWARELKLPCSGVRLFLYDTDADASVSSDADIPAGAEMRVPVVLLHGLGDEADTWRHMLPVIAPLGRALAFDLPGFGRSGPAKRRETIPFLIGIVLELLDALNIPRAALVGHSAGAVIAQAFALQHSDRVERLVLVGGGLVARQPKIDPGLMLFLVPGLGEWAYTRLRKDSQRAYRSLDGYYNRLEDLPQAERDFLYQRVNQRVWSDSQRRGFFALLRGLAAWLPAQQKGLAERLRVSSIPTTVVWGEDDRVTAIENARALIELLPVSRLVTVPGAGHNVQQEQPEKVVEAILNE